MHAMKRLDSWFREQCDGDWEHQYGVKIETLDNPGWSMIVDLVDTPWERAVVPRTTLDSSDEGWLDVEVTGGRFVGTCGVGNLEELLEAFMATMGRLADE